MTELNYEDLMFPNYVNSRVAITLKAKDRDKIIDAYLTLSDVVIAAELAGLNMLFISDAGRGKSQLASDIAWHHFGGYDLNGNANWSDGRPNFDIQELFERTVINRNEGVYDSDEATQIKEEITSRYLFVVDEINRAPKIRQNEFFDLAEGKYTRRGKRLKLGRNDYSEFIATANLNKSNGDFQGTFDLDRALLNRAHLTIDLDHREFRPTPEDKIKIDERKADPKLIIAPSRDISSRIIEEHKKIMEQTRVLDPHMLAFKFIIDDGLNFCDKDIFKEKTTTFPMLCGDCNYSGKEMCSLVKSSSDRTTSAVKALSYALARIAEIKYGKKLEISTLDAALEAYKFTTYHGNLNDVIVESEYGSRKQELMGKTIEKLGEKVRILNQYLPLIIQGRDPVILVYSSNGLNNIVERTPIIVKKLNESGISFKEQDLKTELKEGGIGTDWVDAYVKRFKVQ